MRPPREKVFALAFARGAPAVVAAPGGVLPPELTALLEPADAPDVAHTVLVPPAREHASSQRRNRPLEDGLPRATKKAFQSTSTSTFRMTT